MSDRSLDMIEAAQFGWAFRLNDVWSDVIHDVDDLHPNLRAQFARSVDSLLARANLESPIGWVLLGEGGSGKTHLLNAFRRFAVERGAYFVLLDLTDVRTFWDSALQGYIDSLQQESSDGVPQFQVVLQRLVTEKLGPGTWAPLLAELQNDDLVDETTNRLIEDLWKRDRKIQPHQQDVIRCLAYLNADSFQFYNLGVTWLQGQELDIESRREHGFQRPVEEPIAIAGAISWVMAQTAPTVLALDQLDATVMQLAAGSKIELAADEATAETLLLEISRGLLSLRDKLHRTWSILSCLEQTWSELQRTQLKTASDRFEDPPRVLNRMSDEAVISSLIAQRTAAAAKIARFELRYPTWPIHPEAISKMVGETPRDILKICERHRRECIDRCIVEELKDFDPPLATPAVANSAELIRLDDLFERGQKDADLTDVLADEAEDTFFAPLLEMAAKLAIEENYNNLPEGIILKLDPALPSGRIRPLHARLRVIFEQEGEREQHYSLRVLQKTNHLAYKARLKAAIVASGIDAKLPFRQLRIVRTTPIPTGMLTDRLNRRLKLLGGTVICPDEDELRKLVSLKVLQLGDHKHFMDWVHSRRPISEIGFVRAALPCLQLWGEQRFDDLRIRDYAPAAPDSEDTLSAGPSAPANQLSLGRLVTGNELHRGISVPLSILQDHAVILAGAKSGKSALVKRLTEEVALQGVPTVFLDLEGRSALDEAWDEPPESWEMEDNRKATLFHAETVVKTWTPGLPEGRELPVSAFNGDINFKRLIEPSERGTTISVISGVGIPTEERQAFITRFLNAVGYWAKTHPRDEEQRLPTALLVLDELDHCVGQRGSKECAASFKSLVTEAKRADLGILVSFRDIADIPGDVINSFGTLFVGRAHSPETIATLQELIFEKGGDGRDLGRLSRGEFYVCNPLIEDGTAPKIYCPVCLSRHPKAPLNQTEILGKARAASAQLELG